MLGVGKVRKEKCPDGSTRNVYKNPRDAFPLEIKNFKANFQGEIDALERLRASGQADVQSLVVGLLCQIDEVNRSMQMQFSAVYISYSANPCDSDKWLKKKVGEIINQEASMRERLAKIRRDIESSNNVKNALTEASIDLGANTQKTIETQFKLAVEDSEEWKNK